MTPCVQLTFLPFGDPKYASDTDVSKTAISLQNGCRSWCYYYKIIMVGIVVVIRIVATRFLNTVYNSPHNVVASLPEAKSQDLSSVQLCSKQAPR